MPYGLKDIELAKLNEVFAANERIERVILYGSRAKGNYKPFSDVDITLEGAELTHTDLNRISLAIDDLLLPYQFDISIFHTLKNEALIDHIRRMGITIFEKKSEWKEYKLGEIAEITPGFAFKSKDFGQVGELVVKIKDITPPYIDLTNADHVDLSSYDKNKLSKYLLCEGDYAVAMTGATIGKVGKLKTDKYAYLNQRVAKIKAKEGVCDDFVYYSICGDDFQAFIQNNIDSNSAQENISANSIGRFPVSLPPLSTQHRIAAILSSLDDKIDLLHRENATLEQMAETLFRQWFVVEAKEEWEEGTIVDFAKHCKDSINPQKHPNIVFEHYSIPAFDDGKKPTTETGENIQSNKYLVPSNCILFSKLNPHKDKRVWLMLDDVPDNAICSTEFQIVKPSNPEYLYLLYGWLTNKENYDEIASGVGGTSGSHQRIDPKSIFSFSCPNVDIETIRNYNNKVEPLFYKIRNNQKQIQTLIQTRDGLLPRLMSGEVKL